VHSTNWLHWAWPLILILGLTPLSCATQVGKQPALLSNTRPRTLDSELQTAKQPDATTKTKLQVTYAKVPLHFEPNQGQTDEQVNFLSRGSGYTLFLTATEAVLALRKPYDDSHNSLAPVPDSFSSPLPWRERIKERGIKDRDPESMEQTVLQMKLVGANPNPHVAGQEELPGKVNYIIGNDPEKWRTNIPTFGKVRYENVYPGVDLVYYGNQRQLEFDFVVTPGADPASVKLAFTGADTVEIDTQDNLILYTGSGEVRLLKPQIYQETDGVRQLISGRYVFLGPETPDSELLDSELRTLEVGFEVAAYDISRPLIIDPVLSYSTYLGGNGEDSTSSLAPDGNGGVWVAGETPSTDFPTTGGGSGDPGDGVERDVFVSHFTVTGTLTFSTYLGVQLKVKDESSRGRILLIPISASGQILRNQHFQTVTLVPSSLWQELLALVLLIKMAVFECSHHF